MGRRHFKLEQIIRMLREAEIKLAGGKTIDEVSRKLGYQSEATTAGAKSSVECRFHRRRSSRLSSARMHGSRGWWPTRR